MIRRSRPYLSHRVLRPFLESYRVVADQLATPAAFRALRGKALPQSLPRAGGGNTNYKSEFTPLIPYQRHFFKTALKLAKNRDLLGEGDESLAQARLAFADEIVDAVRRADVIVALAAGRRARLLT